MSKRIRIGTRGSKLALWQANFVKDELEKNGIVADLEIIKTQGDIVQNLSFDKLEGKGFFTSELEEALSNGSVDLAVHSMKDLPTESPEHLMIAGVSSRENPADWLIIHPEHVDNSLPLGLKSGAIVGTSSNRRKAQLKYLRPDVEIRDIRGNVPTRLKKIESGEVEAGILAAAGLLRIAAPLDPFKVVKLHPREFIPAPAQGVLAYQIRQADTSTLQMVRDHLHHAPTARLTNIERKVLKLMQGGCHLPLGAYCETDKLGYFHLYTTYAKELSEPLRHYNLSYSTTDGLAEAIVEYYLNQ